CAGAVLAYNQVCGSLGPNLPLCPSNAKPVINVFTVTPGEIEKGGQVAIQWEVSNAEKVELTQPVQDTLTKSGVKTYGVDQSTNFTLKATNFAGSIEKSITVKLKNSPPVVQSFKADPPVVTAGKSDKVALSWTVAGADSVSVEGVPGAAGATGSVQIDPPAADKVYTLIATNSTGQTKQTLTLKVSSAGCTLTAAANMHEGPKEVYRVIDSLPAGTQVLPLGRNGTGEWLRVQANKEGWVNAAAIKCKLPVLDFATISPAEIPVEPTSTPTVTPVPTDTPTPTLPPSPTPTATVFKPPIIVTLVKPPILINPGLFLLLAGSSLDDYVGHWVPDNSSWNGVVVIDIVKKNSTQLGVHAYGQCSPSYCDWGEVIVNFTGSPVVANFSNGGQLTITMNSYTSLRAVESSHTIDYHKP
ncbi:MAG TPA: SH3 domain-containing protein, partial [Anaerolineae bacterium]